MVVSRHSKRENALKRLFYEHELRVEQGNFALPRPPRMIMVALGGGCRLPADYLESTEEGPFFGSSVFFFQYLRRLIIYFFSSLHLLNYFNFEF